MRSRNSAVSTFWPILGSAGFIVADFGGMEGILHLAKPLTVRDLGALRGIGYGSSGFVPYFALQPIKHEHIMR